ncbi:Unknown protein, partial [Striga hermonthica]
SYRAILLLRGSTSSTSHGQQLQASGPPLTSRPSSVVCSTPTDHFRRPRAAAPPSSHLQAIASAFASHRGRITVVPVRYLYRPGPTLRAETPLFPLVWDFIAVMHRNSSSVGSNSETFSLEGFMSDIDRKKRKEFEDFKPSHLSDIRRCVQEVYDLWYTLLIDENPIVDHEDG